MAREVKELLLKYPKNRNKNRLTKGRDLKEVFAMTDIPKLNAQTINKYLQTYGTMFEWAKRNGYVKENVFAGLTIRSTKRAAVVRKSFSSAEITSLYDAIIHDDGNLIRRPYQKWDPLSVYIRVRASMKLRRYT